MTAPVAARALQAEKAAAAASRASRTVAIASGKGGTGKTTVATNLAAVAAAMGRKVQLLDCDVEAPNAHLFLSPTIETDEPACVPVPVVDEARCTACGECGAFCRFSAIVSLKTKPLVFPELCHGCGGCALFCPEGAITEARREIGRVRSGRAGKAAFSGGELAIGEAMSPPLIRQVKSLAAMEGLVILDSPPGAACPAVEAVRAADLAILVTEPTPFGLNDLAIAAEAFRRLAVPVAVVVNRASRERPEAREWCAREGLPILAEFPDDRRVAAAYSRGELASDAVPEIGLVFERLLDTIERRLFR